MTVKAATPTNKAVTRLMRASLVAPRVIPLIGGLRYVAFRPTKCGGEKPHRGLGACQSEKQELGGQVALRKRLC